MIPVALAVLCIAALVGLTVSVSGMFMRPIFVVQYALLGCFFGGLLIVAIVGMSYAAR